MSDQEKIEKLVAACQKANRYLAELAETGGKMPGEDPIYEWCLVQQGLANALIDLGRFQPR
jgi:hypothetical protein